MWSQIRKIFIGTPLNPMVTSSRRHVALIALVAWVSLGADALSSSCYGPEEAFLALGVNTHLALYISAITIVTIFIIAIGYNQVIELFPGGGGGYKVATTLLHPYAGLVSGAALIVDYVLTVTVSIASGTDAIFSFLPIQFIDYKLYIETAAIFGLLAINMRGLRESMKILIPIFLGFVFTHCFLIIYGVVAHSRGLTTMIPIAVEQTHNLAQSVGWIAVLGLILHAYSLGSGTYTGLEAVSNNVQDLAEPRINTGKRTMFYMALSLSFTAGGIILLYLLWDVQHVPGQTLNASVFHSILGTSDWGNAMWIMTLVFEAGLLLVAANTGFVDGPNVLANMASGGWVPNRFRHLSNRLAIQNGLFLLGVAAFGILLWTGGDVSMLVVLYSINVFITFSLSLLGIAVYWIKHRASPHWFWHFLLAGFACLITTCILFVTLTYKFMEGGWFTLLITSSLIVICLMVNSHYRYIAKKLALLDKTLRQPLDETCTSRLGIDYNQRTAVIFVNSLSVGMHTLLSVIRLFPEQYRNFVFISAGTVDAESFRAQDELETMQAKVNDLLDYFVKFCCQNGYPAEAYASFGTDTVKELENLATKVGAKYPNSIFFASQLIFANDNMVTRFLHNQTPQILQNHLNMIGEELVIMPMKI